MCDRIQNFRPTGTVLSAQEKSELAEMVTALADNKGLGVALSALWEQQRAVGFVLGTPSVGKNLDDQSRFLAAPLGRHWLIHSAARKERSNVPFLTKRGILSQHPRFVYEKLDGRAYEHSAGKQPGFEMCFLCSAAAANPNEVLCSMVLGDREFVYGVNYAALGHCHVTLWTKVPIDQTYWPGDALFWLCEHGRRLRTPEYTTFFNGLGAGNSIKHFHYQTLREVFPICQARPERVFTPSGIARLDWPMPAYGVAAARDDSQVLSRLDEFICAWLDLGADHSLNLVHTTDPQDRAHIVFVPRVKTKLRPQGISNGFAGCEVGGRINVEEWDEWDSARRQPLETVEGWLRAIAPSQGLVRKLEATL